MSSCLAIRWVLGAAVLAVFGSPGRAQVPVDHCAKCHEKEASLEKDHPHARGDVHCTDCHGGDSTQADKQKAKAEGTGYKGVLQREVFPTLCGDCHADVRRMNPFGLPTDQLAQYRTSHHGEAFFGKHDMRVATCVDCHGSHGILGAHNSESPVYPTNVVSTCAKCHSDPKLVEEEGLEGGEEKAYRGSVHAEYLFEKGDLSAPQCATCHGNHGAVPPGFRDVGAVCGKCHVKQKEMFDQSPHKKLVAEGEFNACVTCHGNHKVRPASTHILKSVCVLCHEEGDKGFAVRQRLLEDFDSVQSEFAATQEKLDEARSLGHAGEDALVLLENARTAMIEMGALQHSLNPKGLDSAIADARTNLKRLDEQIVSAESAEHLKRLALTPVVLFLLAMSLGFWVRFRRIHREKEAT